MKVLVTGASGFVGKYLTDELVSHDHQVVGLLGLHESEQVFNHLPVQVEQADIRNLSSLKSIFQKHNPDAVVHLAAISHVVEAEKLREELFRINVEGTFNVCMAAQEVTGKIRFLFASSSLVYGSQHSGKVDELSPTSPETPYAMSKLAGEQVVNIFSSEKFKPYIVRPFNHIGPGQHESFVCPAFAKRILLAPDHSEVEVGNLDAVRDFSDVRDVVKAYRLIIEKSPSASLFVLGSGQKKYIRDVFESFVRFSKKDIRPKIDQKLLRNKDQAYIIADTSLAQKDLAWTPKISFEQSLEDVFHSLKSKL